MLGQHATFVTRFRVTCNRRSSYVAFVPAPLPRRLTLELETITALSSADSSLGQLAGTGRLLPDPHLLLTPFLRREALASARIEGTQASLAEVFEAEAGTGRQSPDVLEVTNYIAALNHGLSRLDTLPLSGRLIREMHEVLLRGVRGHERTPGDFRRSQNWIGGTGETLESAIFVPPPVDEMTHALGDWEKYAHDDAPELPLLIRTALLHYQFETIHPFLDGNGPLGRLFIVLYLVERRALPNPLLPLSPFFERNRDDYYRRLQDVRERGEIQEWLRFFLRGVTEQATDALVRAKRLLDLREQYRWELRGSRSRAIDVVDLLFVSPVLTKRTVARQLDVTTQTASKVLRQLTDLGALREVSPGQGSRSRWFADTVLETLTD